MTMALDNFRRDLAYAARSLARARGHSAAIIIVLGLGIAACAAVFSVVNAVLLKPLPYADPERVVVLLHGGRSPVAPANYLDWKRELRTFSAVGAAEVWGPSLTGSDHAERISAVRVSAGLLPMIGVTPLVGRLFTADEDEAGREHVVVLEHSFWQSRFASDPAVVGRTITLDGEGYAVVGVAPPGFGFPHFWADGAQLWSPLPLASRAGSRRGESLRVFARLAPGATLPQARAEVAAVTSRLEAQFPGTNRDVQVVPVLDMVVGDVRPAILVLFGAVGFVLLIACANVAHMLLARATARQREMAMRLALGASRARLVAQLGAESLLLAGAGGILGIVLARFGVRALLALAPPGLPRVAGVALDGGALFFTASVTLATGIVFGLAPAFHATRRDVTLSLRGARGTTDGAGRASLRGLLVGSELALAVVLLIGAGLMVRSFVALRAIDTGFNPQGVMTMVVATAGSGAAEPARRPRFFQEVVRDIAALPGVEAASAINHLPIAGDVWGWAYRVEGRNEPTPDNQPRATYRVVLPRYFAAMQVQVLRGRDLDDRDVASAPGVVVVNEALAARQWPGEDAVGKRIAMAGKDAPWLAVVGVVKNTVRGRLAAPPDDEVYLPYLQATPYLEEQDSHFGYLTLVARTSGDTAALAPAMRRVVWRHEPNAPVAEVAAMAAVVNKATAAPRFYLVLLGAFSAVALLLAAVGIYAVMSYAVARRTNEIGIRMALGAARAQVLRLVLRQGAIVGIGGAVAGLVGALLLTRLMGSMLYGVGARDPLTFGAVAALLTAVALGASYLPARRAARLEPLRALRED